MLLNFLSDGKLLISKDEFDFFKSLKETTKKKKYSEYESLVERRGEIEIVLSLFKN